MAAEKDYRNNPRIYYLQTVDIPVMDELYPTALLIHLQLHQTFTRQHLPLASLIVPELDSAGCWVTLWRVPSGRVANQPTRPCHCCKPVYDYRMRIEPAWARKNTLQHMRTPAAGFKIFNTLNQRRKRFYGHSDSLLRSYEPLLLAKTFFAVVNESYYSSTWVPRWGCGFGINSFT